MFQEVTINTPPKQEATEKAKLRELYPPSEAYANGTLQVDSLHTLYYEVHGDADATTSDKKSALFLHGGPGSGCTPTHARFFDPTQYGTIVLLDQRGCGRSTPRAYVENNTLLHLVEDCETLRKHLQLEAWDVVLGGSWGSTLALAYAQEHPERVQSIILRGVCTLRKGEVDWLFTPQGGAARKNEQIWNTLQKAVDLSSSSHSDNENDDVDDVSTSNNNSNNNNAVKMETATATPDRTVLHEYYDRMFGTNTTHRWNAARSWMMYEYAISQTYKTGGTNNETPPESPAVLVAPSKSDHWMYQDRLGNPLSNDEWQASSLESPDIAGSQLRQGLPYDSSTEELVASTATEPRPIGMTYEELLEAQDEQYGNFSGLPAMAMLTCFYSVNNGYAMNNTNLLSPTRIQRIRHIPCIVVQGGQDPICPPDTALDLKKEWPELELIIPILAGHSMYHPEIVHELVQATDRLAR